MALPPDRITVKRRRDEEPVEALYIQQKKQRPSAVWRLCGNENEEPRYATPSLIPSDTREENRSSTAPSSNPVVPTVRTTLHREEVSEQTHGSPQLLQHTLPEARKPTFNENVGSRAPTLGPSASSQRQNGTVRLHAEPRRFHLTKGALPIPSEDLLSKNGLQKHRKSRRNELAIFVEKQGKMLNSKNGRKRQRKPTEQDPLVKISESSVVRSEPSRKRPNATAAERKWRAENWGKSFEPEQANDIAHKAAESVKKPSNQWHYGSIKLAAELHEIALQETQAQDVRRPGEPKVKPKPPRPRQSNTQHLAIHENWDEDMPDVDLDDETEFVLDTYVILNTQQNDLPNSTAQYIDSLQGIENGNVGVLVIEDEEEALWETFGEDQESDREWNSEEEDENAEDFYGNDYPEDEVNSDDEYGRGAYNYRHGASDEEEFGEEIVSWSDEEDGARRPWSLSRGHTGLRDGDDDL